MPLAVSQFRNRFTEAEKQAIYAAAASSIAIRVWLDDLAAVTVVLDPADPTIVLAGVQLDNPRTIAGVQGLEAAGLIAAGRAAEILELPAAEFPPVGGYTLGQMITLKEPFGLSYPGEHEIIGFGPECVTLAIGQFALVHVEAA